MVRLFVYIRESLAGAAPEESLLAAWQRTLGGNPITDILQGNPRLEQWGHSAVGDEVVLTDFMLNSSVGRLRAGHVYEDTETVLIEMAERMGMENQIRSWLRTPGYLPESAMYAFYGRPDRVRLVAAPAF